MCYTYKPEGGMSDSESLMAQYQAVAPDPLFVTVEVALLSVSHYQLWALLRLRAEEPFKDAWSLPGLLLDRESLDQTARTVVRGSLGLEGVFVEQLQTFGDPGRDPRARVLTVSYLALVPQSRAVEALGRKGLDPLLRLGIDEAGNVEAFEGPGRVELAFDHKWILGAAVQRLRSRLVEGSLAYSLLEPDFTLRQLQAVHETVLNRQLNKDSFRRRMLASGEIEATGRWETEVGHRPAELYRRKPEEIWP
jgi:8-oxo-dGTP diphosphatase